MLELAAEDFAKVKNISLFPFLIYIVAMCWPAYLQGNTKNAQEQMNSLCMM